MNVLKAYADGNINHRHIPAGKFEKAGGGNFHEIIKNSGDSISFSDEAMEMLAGKRTSPSVCPQDATYDQYGNVNRQLEALQRDLRNLTFSAWPVNAVFAGQVNQLQNQVARLQMQV